MRSRMAYAGFVPCLAALLLAANPAMAQPVAMGDTPKPPVATGDTPKPPVTDPAQLEEAKRHMKAGAAFYNDPRGHRCEEALREFRRAYELSGSLNAVKGMAICALELERDGESIQLYTTYLAGKGASLDPAERAQVESDLNTLKAAVATVTLSADRAGVRVTDVRTPAKGSPVRNTYTLPAKLGIHPGQHVFTAAADGTPDQAWKVEIGNGGSYAHAFTFGTEGGDGGRPTEPPSGPLAPTRPVPASVWATAGLTVALAVPWAVLAVRAKDKNDEYQQENGKAPAAALSNLRNDVKNANLLADVFLGVTLASLTATAVLFFTRPTKMGPRPSWGTPPSPLPSRGVSTGTFTISPRVGVSSGGAALTGWF